MDEVLAFLSKLAAVLVRTHLNLKFSVWHLTQACLRCIPSKVNDSVYLTQPPSATQSIFPSSSFSLCVSNSLLVRPNIISHGASLYIVLLWFPMGLSSGLNPGCLKHFCPIRLVGGVPDFMCVWRDVWKIEQILALTLTTPKPLTSFGKYLNITSLSSFVLSGPIMSVHLCARWVPQLHKEGGG